MSLIKTIISWLVKLLALIKPLAIGLVLVLRVGLAKAFPIFAAIYNIIAKIGFLRIIAICFVFSFLAPTITTGVETGDWSPAVSQLAFRLAASEYEVIERIDTIKATENPTFLEHSIQFVNVFGAILLLYYMIQIVSWAIRTMAGQTSFRGIPTIVFALAFIGLLEVVYLGALNVHETGSMLGLISPKILPFQGVAYLVVNLGALFAPYFSAFRVDHLISPQTNATAFNSTGGRGLTATIICSLLPVC